MLRSLIYNLMDTVYIFYGFLKVVSFVIGLPQLEEEKDSSN